MFAGMTASYLFRIAGDGESAEWHVVIDHGAITASQNGAAAADLVITMAEEDWPAFARGELTTARGLVSGKLAIEGDIPLTMKLRHFCEG